jgi:hypothetical protein
LSIHFSTDDFRRTSLNFMKSGAGYNFEANSVTTPTASEANYFMPIPLDLKVEDEDMPQKDNENLDHKSGM